MSERGAEGILRRRAEAQKAVQEAADRRAAEATSKAVASRKADAGTVAATKPKGGRIKSAATGAAGGSVGGPGGAAAGAVTGFLSGGKGRSRKSGNKALIGEFGLCMAILLLQPLVEGGGATTTGKFMKKASATAAVFIILGFISSVGETPKRVANGLGALMTVTVILNERSAFGQLVKAVGGDPVSVGGPIKLGGPTKSGDIPLGAVEDFFTKLGDTILASDSPLGAVEDFFTKTTPESESAYSTSPFGQFAHATGIKPASADVNTSGLIQKFNNSLEKAQGESVAAKAWNLITGIFS